MQKMKQNTWKGDKMHKRTNKPRTCEKTREKASKTHQNLKKNREEEKGDAATREESASLTRPDMGCHIGIRQNRACPDVSPYRPAI
jgi:hypothetical protein